MRWVYVCVRVDGCVGEGDMVYGCGCEGGQDENSDYICAEYCNQYYSNNVYDISIVCVLLCALKF